MRRSLQKFMVLMLCAAVMLAGSGFAGAYAGAIAHDLGIETVSGSPADAPLKGGERAIDEHGCAAHLGMHLLATTDDAPSLFPVPARSTLEPRPDARVFPALPDLFYRPPRLLSA